MMIFGKQLQSILQTSEVTSTRRKNAVTETSAVKKTDSLVLSSAVQELQFAKEQVLKSPDIRAEKVTELKKQLQQGKYQISGTDIAQRMFSANPVE